MQTKRCTKCGQEFPAKRRDSDDLHPRCKTCEPGIQKTYAGNELNTDPSILKTCAGCGETYPAIVEYFSPLKMGRHGLHPRCRKCSNAYRKTLNHTANTDASILKSCSRCNQVYPATTEFFVPDKRRPDGLSSNCRPCHLEICAEYRSSNLDKVRKTSRESNKRKRAENPERFKQIRIQYTKKHPDKVRARKKRHYEKYRDRETARMRKHYADNAEEYHIKRVEQYAKNADQARQYSRDWYKANKDRAYKSGEEWRKKNSHKVKLYTKNWQDRNPEKRRLYTVRRRARKKELPDTLTIAEWNMAIEYWDNSCAYCGKRLEVKCVDHFVPLSHPKCPGTIAKNCIPACKPCNSSKFNKVAFDWMKKRFGEGIAQRQYTLIIEYFDNIEG